MLCIKCIITIWCYSEDDKYKCYNRSNWRKVIEYFCQHKNIDCFHYMLTNPNSMFTIKFINIINRQHHNYIAFNMLLNNNFDVFKYIVENKFVCCNEDTIFDLVCRLPYDFNKVDVCNLFVDYKLTRYFSINYEFYPYAAGRNYNKPKMYNIIVTTFMSTYYRIV